MAGSLIIFWIASKLEPPNSFGELFISNALGLNVLEKNIAKRSEKMEKTIKLIGPKSEIEVLPQISVEKYLATVDPKKAPNEPPALIIPKNFFESVCEKKLIIVTQKMDTTKNEYTFAQI